LHIRDAGSILCSSSGKIARDIITRFGESIKKEFVNAPKWNSCSHFTKRFAGVVVDEAHLLRNNHSVTTRAVLALTRSCHYRFILTGTPFNNRIDDVATLAWLLSDEQPWSKLQWWKQLPLTSDRVSQESCQASLSLWRQSILMRGKDVLAAHLPDRVEVVTAVEPCDSEQLYGAILYVKLQTSVKDYERAQNTGDNRFIAFQKVLSCLMRLMQSTTHALIVAGRGCTHQYSHLSRTKSKAFCVNCKSNEDQIAMDCDLLRNEQDEEEVGARPKKGARSSKSGSNASLDDFVVDDSDEDDAVSDCDGAEIASDDSAPVAASPEDDDDDAPMIVPKATGTANNPNKLPCGHHLCSACIALCTTQESKSISCSFCRDMNEIQCKVSPEDSPTSSKLQALVDELMTLPQCDRALHPVSSTLKRARYARGSTAPWHVLWENSKQKSSTKAKAEVSEGDGLEHLRPRSIEKAVVFALFNASLDRTSQSTLLSPTLTQLQCAKSL
jgi:SNF2 family DNA or RNA helicase